MGSGGVAEAKLCAVSIDLDEIPFYHQIHGLAPPDERSAHLVFDVALARLEALACSFAMPLTFFVIGSTVARPDNAARLRALAGAGHEIGNHTFAHRYDLTRLDRAAMKADIELAQNAIESATGTRPAGFRAPGYTVTDELLALVEDAGFVYDSSVFPCPLYFGAKGLAMASIRLRRRRSQSVLDTPEVLLAPTRPYRMGRPYWRRGGGLWELPVQVTRVLRLPFIGTSLTMAGPRVARHLTSGVLGERLINLELHGIDVLDATDGLQALAHHQLDVKLPVRRKLETFAVVFETLRDAGYRFVTLADGARMCDAVTGRP